MATDPKSSYYDVGIETIRIIKAKLSTEEFRGYLKGNILKYLCRMKHKGCEKRDAEKIVYFSKWLDEALEGAELIELEDGNV